MRNLPYEDFVERKIDDIASKNSNIISHCTKCNEDDNVLEITLCYRGFTVEIEYSDYMPQGYTFMENFESGNCLITKFVFPFSKIPYSIYDVHNAVEDETFVTYDFHCLYDEQHIENALNTIMDFISRNESRISTIYDSPSRKALLEQSFSNAINVAAKKLDITDFDEDLKGSMMTLDDKLYTLRLGETVFTDFITKGKVNALQRFYTAHSKKNTLLTYEERYLEHLYKNDFKNTDSDFEAELKEKEKASKGISRASTIIGLVSIALAVGFSVLTGIKISDHIFEDYYVLNGIDPLRFVPTFIFILGFCCFTGIIYTLLFDKDTKKGNSKKDIIKFVSIFTITGILILSLGTGTQYLYMQRNVAIGKQDIYICTGLHKPETYNFSKSKIYIVQDTESQDQYAAIVVNDDYKNYYTTDCFYEDAKETTNKIKSLPCYAGDFDSIEKFETAFKIK